MESHYVNPRRLPTRPSAMRIPGFQLWKNTWVNLCNQNRIHRSRQENQVRNTRRSGKSHAGNSLKEDVTRETNAPAHTSSTYHFMNMEVVADSFAYPIAPEDRNAISTMTRTVASRHGNFCRNTKSILIRSDWWKPKRRPSGTRREEMQIIANKTRSTHTPSP